MNIPSPRTFIEIAAFSVFAFFTCIGIIGASALLAGFVLVEKAVDSVQRWQMRRRT